jgi:hypothetical protein
MMSRRLGLSPDLRLGGGASAPAAAPEIDVTVNAVAQADNSTFSPSDPTIGATVQYTVEVTNNGDAELTLVNATRSGAVSAVTAWNDTTVAPAGTATCTITLTTSSAGAQSGYFEFTTNDNTDGEDVYRVNVAYDVLAPVLSVTGNGVSIANGDATPDAADHTQFTTKDAAANSDRTFTINNTGNADLTGVNVLVPSGYTLVTPPDATIAAAGSDTFLVRCNSSTPGSASGNITIESNELADHVFAVACTVRTYLEKSLNLGTPKQILVGNETSGTTAEDATAENNDGAYSGVTINSAASPVSGDNAPLWDGVNDNLNAFSAGLASDFNGQEFTIGCWVKVSGAGIWTDATVRRILHFYVDANNELWIERTGTNNQIRFIYRAGGTLETVTHTISTTNWFRAEMVVSLAGDSMKCFVDGVQVGTTQTGLGTWSGSLVNAYYGANRLGNGAYWSGYLYHGRYGVSPLSDADVAKLTVVP